MCIIIIESVLLGSHDLYKRTQQEEEEANSLREPR